MSATVRPELAGAGDQYQPRWSVDVEDLRVVDQIGRIQEMLAEPSMMVRFCGSA
jgi:hypothetical protein